jgi:hypothetical protein
MLPFATLSIGGELLGSAASAATNCRSRSRRRADLPEADSSGRRELNALNDRSRGMIMSPLLSFVAALERPTQREQFIIVERAPVRWEVPHTAHGALAFEDQ